MPNPTLLIGYPMGSPIGLVAALAWADIAHDIARVDLLARSKAFLAINRRGEVPVLIDADGNVLTETLTIARWIEDRDSHRRVTFTPGTLESLRMWEIASFINTGFTAAFAPFWTAMEAPQLSESEREVLRSFGRQQVRKRHDQLEVMIGDSPWLAGERRSLADAVLLGVARWNEFHAVLDMGDYPRINRVRASLAGDGAAEAAARVETDVEDPRVVDLADALARAR